MSRPAFPSSRRLFLGTLATGAVYFTTRGAFAEQLALTPSREEGPFYPDRLPLDTDNDLIIINDNLTPAVGEITDLTGRVLDASGSPLSGAAVEIWQSDAKGIYLHSNDGRAAAGLRDSNFQGYGRFLTGSSGAYRFRTIKPVAYQGRPAPHIHIRVKKGERELLTTQLNIAGHPGNALDPIASGGLTLFERELLMAEFKPIKGSKIGELAAHFEIVIGRTPDERSFQR
jgi:protocatechuate 3,4-dioxygenase beta subunit